MDRRWVKAARQEAQQAVSQHLKPAEQASQTRSYTKTKLLFAKSPARGPRRTEPKSIPIPKVEGFSIQHVSAAYLDKGPKTEAVKLTFQSDADLQTAFKALNEMVPGRVRIDEATPETGEKPALSFHGSVADLEKIATQLEAQDMETYGTESQDPVETDESTYDDATRFTK